MGNCRMGYGLPKPRRKFIVLRAEWYQGIKICGAANNLLREPGDTLLQSTFPAYSKLYAEVTIFLRYSRDLKLNIKLNENGTVSLQLRETRRETSRRELKPT